MRDGSCSKGARQLVTRLHDLEHILQSGHEIFLQWFDNYAPWYASNRTSETGMGDGRCSVGSRQLLMRLNDLKHILRP